jgi:kynureninase
MKDFLKLCQQHDAADPIAHFRERFCIDDPDLIYLDGNSLGRLPKQSAQNLRAAIDVQWGRQLIRGWNEGWYTAPQRIGGKLAQLLGAQPNEVVLCDQTTLNLYKLTMAALHARPGRKTIVTDAFNFPSDLYVLQGTGHTVHTITSPDGIGIPTSHIVSAINPDTALVTLSHVAFKSGYIHDLAAITQATHAAGALVLWDLSHSAGALPIELNRCDADLAVGCTYKYLNGGPGAPAFLYVRQDLQSQLVNPIQGWFAQSAPFAFGQKFNAVANIARFMVGTPPVLSLMGAEAGIDLHIEVGIDKLWAKSRQQSELLIALWREFLQPLGFSLNSPLDVNQRGSHLALGHAEGYRITQALVNDMNVIPDFRAPDNIRIGIAPIYTRFVDLYEFVQRLRRVMAEKLYAKYPLPQAGDVT